MTETARISADEAAAIVERLEQALAAGAVDLVRNLLAGREPSDIAELVESLPREARARLVDLLGDEFDFDILPELDDEVREQVIEQLDPHEVGQALTELESDDAVEIFEELEPDAQREVLDAVSPSERALLEESLTFPEESAGRLMQRETLALPVGWSVGQAIDHLRSSSSLPPAFYDLFLVDADHRLKGIVPVHRLLASRREIALAAIANPSPHVIPVTMDQEEVAHLFRKYGLVSAPVIGGSERLVGMITVDDIVDVIDEEADEDIMHLSGLGESDFYRTALRTTGARFTWLAVNLATAFIAALVIGQFTETIQAIVAVAVLMPIVASMGGNAGIQALAVVVRALSLRQITASNRMRVLVKEVAVGALNGVLFAGLVGVAASLWLGDVRLGAVLGAAMIVNMLVAGIAGSSVPLGLRWLGIDPAVASGVILTALTDVIGFLAFLGLATLFLL